MRTNSIFLPVTVTVPPRRINFKWLLLLPVLAMRRSMVRTLGVRLSLKEVAAVLNLAVAFTAVLISAEGSLLQIAFCTAYLGISILCVKPVTKRLNNINHAK